MSDTVEKARLLPKALTSLLVAGGVGAFHFLRSRFQHQQIFVPDRYPNGIWNPAPFGVPAEDLWFETEDGVVLHGWWIPYPKAVGTLLYCHGNTGSIAHRVGIFRHLRRLKVNLLAFDYRGFGRSDGEPSERGLYRDVQAAHDCLTGRLEQEPERIILFGHSLGGAVAIDGALHRPVAGLVVQSSFTQLRDMARAFFPGLPLYLVARNSFRSLEKVSRLTLPKLLIHGTADGTVPLALGKKLYEAAAEPKELYVVANAEHNDVHRHGGFRYLRRLAKFRDRCLKNGNGLRLGSAGLQAEEAAG